VLGKVLLEKTAIAINMAMAIIFMIDAAGTRIRTSSFIDTADVVATTTAIIIIIIIVGMISSIVVVVVVFLVHHHCRRRSRGHGSVDSGGSRRRRCRCRRGNGRGIQGLEVRQWHEMLLVMLPLLLLQME